MAVKTYSFGDGKYEIDRDTSNLAMTACRRNQRPWLAGFMDFQFSNAVHQMLNRIDELEALSVTQVLLNVVPGDGSGQEVYAKSVNEVVEALSAMGLQNEDLAGHLATVRAALQEAATLLRKYEGYHRAKGTEESTTKAEVNAEVAGRFEKILDREHHTMVGTLDELREQIGDLLAQHKPADWDAIHAHIAEYVEGYEMRGETADGLDAVHQPTDGDRALLTDAINGLLADPEFLVLLRAA